MRGKRGNIARLSTNIEPEGIQGMTCQVEIRVRSFVKRLIVQNLLHYVYLIA